MADSNTRPSLVAKPTHVRYQKHHATHPHDLPAPARTLDRLIIGLGYGGVAAYIYHNFRKLSPWEITGISLGSLSLGYSLFDLGKRNGVIQGASFAVRSGDDGSNTPIQDLDDEESWKGEFLGREFEHLEVAEKISWLKNEQQRIRDLQEDEQLRCGQAYIAKEDSYKAYEKRGAYGGPDWQRYVLERLVIEDMMLTSYKVCRCRLGM